MKMPSFVVLALLVRAMVPGLAEAASIQYSTTSLGADFTLQTDAGGHVAAVTNASGTASYAFDKAPVSATSTPTVSPPDWLHGGATLSYAAVTLKNANYQVGVTPTSIPYTGLLLQPSFLGATYNGWFGTNPISDMNEAGQVVGQSGFGSTGFAAFSAPGAQSHGFNSGIVDDLNNYVAAVPGVRLTSAFKIDDLGQILARGTDDQTYLLTPTEMGGSRSVPEPTTLTAWAMVGVVLAIGRRGLRSDRAVKG